MALQMVLMRLSADMRGFAALEYTLITVIIGTVVLSGVHVIGGALTESYTTIGGILQSLASGT